MNSHDKSLVIEKGCAAHHNKSRYPNLEKPQIVHKTLMPSMILTTNTRAFGWQGCVHRTRLLLKWILLERGLTRCYYHTIILSFGGRYGYGYKCVGCQGVNILILKCLRNCMILFSRGILSERFPEWWNEHSFQKKFLKLLVSLCVQL